MMGSIIFRNKGWLFACLFLCVVALGGCKGDAGATSTEDETYTTQRNTQATTEAATTIAATTEAIIETTTAVENSTTQETTAGLTETTTQAAETTTETSTEDGRGAGDDVVMVGQTILGFLEDDSKAITSSEYAKNIDSDYSYGLAYGEYSITEMRDAIFGDQDVNTIITKYAYLDFNQDGELDLGLKFVDTLNYDLTQMFIIINDNGQLTITGQFSIGYRSDLTVLSDGTIIYGGSEGAGYYSESIYRIDTAGNANKEFSVIYLHNEWVPDLSWQSPEYIKNGTYLNYTDYDLSQSELYVVAWVSDNRHAFYDENMSGDEVTFLNESRVLEGLMVLGFDRVTKEEFDGWVEEYGFSDIEITWYTLTSLTESKATEDFNQISLMVTDESQFANYADYSTYIADANGQMIGFYSNNTYKNVKFVRLDVSVVGSDGPLVYNPVVLFTADELSANKPMGVMMTLPEIYPDYGIIVEDENGVDKLYSVNLSGESGLLYLLEEIYEP